MTIRAAINAAFIKRPDTGSGQYVIRLVAELQKPDYGVEPLLFEPPSGRDFDKLVFEQYGFPRAAQQAGSDLAHVPYFGSALFPGIPTVVTIHDLIPLLLPPYRGSFRVRAYTTLVSRAARRANAIIADSQATKRDVVRLLGVDPRKVHVVYLATDEQYQPVTAQPALDAVRRKYHLPEAFVLYLGGYDQRKNVRNVVRAFALVAKGLGPEYSLVLAGQIPENDAGLFPDVRPLIKELELAEHVRFTGEVAEEDKPALYTLAGCFVWPSYYEGFGLPVLEAMACGTPVVASDRGSLPEIVGNAGFLISPDDTRRMAGAIIPSLIEDDLRRANREKGLARAGTFTWQKCAQETIQVYRNVLDEG